MQTVGRVISVTYVNRASFLFEFKISLTVSLLGSSELSPPFDQLIFSPHHSGIVAPSSSATG